MVNHVLGAKASSHVKILNASQGIEQGSSEWCHGHILTKMRSVMPDHGLMPQPGGNHHRSEQKSKYFLGYTIIITMLLIHAV